MKEPDKRERRQLKRRNLSYYLLVLEANSQETIGHLVDISPTGFMLDSPKQLPLEKSFQLMINTSLDATARDHIKLTARSKWCRPDEIDTQLYDVGFTIVEMSKQDAAGYQQIIEKFVRKDGYTFPSM